ncbi:hypothetical protein BD311DRAFT_729644 [Dichomitus squalens]|uniref:Uncharacterized protein n=2 Tax=Dichomitus squalens TaxID=114155 RepID=A0A4Q9MCY5_9APHY|nr:hypothetical protein BD311DRAFT_729644 [Dichomitus squalens]
MRKRDGSAGKSSEGGEGEGRKKTQLRIMPGESMAHFAIDSMRRLVKEAMQTSSARVRQAKKEDLTSQGSKKVAAAANASSKSRAQSGPARADSDSEEGGPLISISCIVCFPPPAIVATPVAGAHSHRCAVASESPRATGQAPRSFMAPANFGYLVGLARSSCPLSVLGPRLALPCPSSRSFALRPVLRPRLICRHMSCLSAWNCELEYPSLLFYPHRLIAFFTLCFCCDLRHLPSATSASLTIIMLIFMFVAASCSSLLICCCCSSRPPSIDVYHHPATVPRSRARMRRNLFVCPKLIIQAASVTD